MNKNYKEGEINLLDLLYNICLSWRNIILAGIIGAVLVGGFKIVSNVVYNSKVDVEEKLISEGKISDYMKEIKESEKLAIDNALNTYEKLVNLKDYKWNSIYINLDPYAENVMYLRYRVNTGYVYNYTKDNKEDYSNDLTNAYAEYFEKISRIESVDFKVEELYFDELVSAYVSSSKKFTIKLVGRTKEELESIANAIQKEIESYKKILDREIGGHEIVLISKSDVIEKNIELLNNINTMNDQINAYENTLAVAENSFSEKQELIYNIRKKRFNDHYETANKIDPDEEKNLILTSDLKNKISIKNDVRKWIVIGGGGSAVLICCYYAFIYFISGAIRSAEELVIAYDIYILGDLSILRKSNKKNFIDRWLVGLKNKEKLEYDTVVGRIEKELMLLCDKEKITELMITTTGAFDEMTVEVIDKISKRLASSKIKVITGERFNSGVKVIEDAARNKKVVIVEKVGVSKNDNLDKMCDICNKQGIEVVGAIVV